MMKKFLLIAILLIVAISSMFFWLNNNKEDAQGLNDSGGNLLFHLNTDLDSNIPFVIQGEAGQKLIAFKKNNSREIEKIVFTSPENGDGIVSIGENGLPKTLEFSGATIDYSNYTNSTVDISIKGLDGKIEVLKNQAIKAKIKSALKIPLVPVAYAAEHSLMKTDIELGLLEDVASEEQTKKAPNDDFYIGTAGQILGVLGCGTNIGIAVVSGGTLAPLAWVGCAALLTRVITVHTEIASCQGDVLECAKNTAIAYIKGTEIKGKITNMATGQVLKDAIVQLYKLNGTLYSEADANNFGNYELDRFGDEIFVMRVRAPQMIDNLYKVISLANKRLYISDLATDEKVFDSGLAAIAADFDNTIYFDIGMRRGVDGIVIDSESADSIANAKISVEKSDHNIFINVVSNEEGKYIFDFPYIIDQDKTKEAYEIKVKANGYEDKTIKASVKKRRNGVQDLNFDTTIRMDTAQTDGKWIFTYSWAAGTTGEKKNTTCWKQGLAFGSSVFHVKINDGLLFDFYRDDLPSIGSINADGDILLDKLGVKGLLGRGSIDITAGTGSGVWTQRYQWPDPPYPTVVADCSGVWTAVQE